MIWGPVGWVAHLLKAAEHGLGETAYLLEFERRTPPTKP